MKILIVVFIFASAFISCGLSDFKNNDDFMKAVNSGKFFHQKNGKEFDVESQIKYIGPKLFTQIGAIDGGQFLITIAGSGETNKIECYIFNDKDKFEAAKNLFRDSLIMKNAVCGNK